MVREDERMDHIFRENALQLQVEPDKSSWERLEVRLPKYSPGYRSWHPVKIAAVLVPLICLTYGSVQFYHSYLADQIIDLSITTEDKYYDNYLGFLRSESYADLKIAYYSQD